MMIWYGIASYLLIYPLPVMWQFGTPMTYFERKMQISFRLNIANKYFHRQDKITLKVYANMLKISKLGFNISPNYKSHLFAKLGADGVEGQSPAWCVCANQPVQTFHAQLRRHALECCPQNVPRVTARWVCDAGCLFFAKVQRAHAKLQLNQRNFAPHTLDSGHTLSRIKKTPNSHGARGGCNSKVVGCMTQCVRT